VGDGEPGCAGGRTPSATSADGYQAGTAHLLDHRGASSSRWGSTQVHTGGGAHDPGRAGSRTGVRPRPRLRGVETAVRAVQVRWRVAHHPDLHGPRHRARPLPGARDRVCPPAVPRQVRLHRGRRRAPPTTSTAGRSTPTPRACRAPRTTTGGRPSGTGTGTTRPPRSPRSSATSSRCWGPGRRSPLPRGLRTTASPTARCRRTTSTAASSSTPPPPWRSAQAVTGSVPGARPRPRSIRPGWAASRRANCSATTSGAWLGSITPPEPTRMRSVAAATMATSTGGFVAATAGMLWCSASQNLR